MPVEQLEEDNDAEWRDLLAVDFSASKIIPAY